MMTASDDNPFRAPQSSFEPTNRKPDSNLRHLRICLGLQCTTIVVGVAAAFYDIESIVATGPILFFIGIPVVILSRRLGLTSGLTFGISGPAISLLCLVLINLLGWSPADAQLPVSTIAAIYTTFALRLGLHVWTRTGYDSFVTEHKNHFDSALSAGEVQHALKNTR